MNSVNQLNTNVQNTHTNHDINIVQSQTQNDQRDGRENLD